jgi:hypothetical protein
MFREMQRDMREEEARKPIRLGPRTKRILQPRAKGALPSSV